MEECLEMIQYCHVFSLCIEMLCETDDTACTFIAHTMEAIGGNYHGRGVEDYLKLY